MLVCVGKFLSLESRQYEGFQGSDGRFVPGGVKRRVHLQVDGGAIVSVDLSPRDAWPEMPVGSAVSVPVRVPDKVKITLAGVPVPAAPAAPAK